MAEEETPVIDAGSVQLQTEGAAEDAGPLPGYEKPSIEVAKQFFEANLPHRIASVHHQTGYRMANKGETYDASSGERAMLFPFWKSTLADLDLFGIGIGLYFRQLLALGIVCALCAVLLLFPTLKNAAVCDQGSIGLLTGSAVGCDRQALDVGWHAVPDILVCLMLLTWAAAASKAEAAAVKVIDEHMQTPSDYAIVVENPPLERDPDVWQAHFAEWGQVVFITVSLNNGDLLEALAKKRSLELKITNKDAQLGLKGIEAENEPKPSALGRFMGAKTIKELTAAKAELEQKIEQLAAPATPYKPNRVYVIFNKEADKQRCMHDCSTSRLAEVGVTRLQGAGRAPQEFGPHDPLAPPPSPLHRSLAFSCFFR